MSSCSWWNPLRFFSEDGVWVAIKRVGNLDVVVFRGSVTPEDWVRDFLAIPRTTRHPELGVVHAGFFLGMVSATTWVAQQLRPGAEVAITGHSLGAARAWLHAGLMLHWKTLVRVVVFGSPKPAFAELAKRIAVAGISTTSYRNATPLGHDRVTDLPFTIEPELPWRQPVPLTDISVPPDAGDTGDFRFHHIGEYEKGAAG